ncbi:ABC transporter permease [bacterium]|nr:ABC transporter permease [bacterium]MCG2676529.1 ABC transporter permease [bacterium]
MKKFFEFIGRWTTFILKRTGEVVILFFRILSWIVRPPLDLKNTTSQMVEIGIRSLPVVSLVALCIGMVSALQGGHAAQLVETMGIVAGGVALGMVRELGPVLTALMLAGRVGAGITAELGTMKVTEQIDALETLATDPIKYLAVPRFIAGVIMTPILTIYATVIGIAGGYFIGVRKLGIGSRQYIDGTIEALSIDALFSGLIKAVVFGAIIITIGCYQGFRTRGGAEGVGRATTLSVVTSCVLILAADYFLTAALF